MVFIESYPTLKQARKDAVAWKLKWKHGDTVIKRERVDSILRKPYWVYNLYSK